MAAPFELMAKQFWPTTFFHRVWQEHPRHAPAIIERLYELKATAPALIASGVALSAKPARGLFESDFDLFATDHAELCRLRSFIEHSVEQAVRQLHADRPDCAPMRAVVVDSWFHITNDGGFHDSHYHGNCSWCGIYYVRVGDYEHVAGGGSAPNGGTRFYSPLAAGGGYTDLGNRYLGMTYLDPPIQDGALLLFPSYLLHGALPYSGAVDRIVIAFNAQVLPV
jgi:uncharacterized protein (TIGR02466 family)